MFKYIFLFYFYSSPASFHMQFRHTEERFAEENWIGFKKIIKRHFVQAAAAATKNVCE